MAQGLKTGGRKRGTPNKASAGIKAAFQKHGDELVSALLALTKSDYLFRSFSSCFGIYKSFSVRIL